jgi:hypothetical protein
MSNFTPIKTGGWSFREKLFSSQMTTFQEHLLKCPNFTDGSSHVPTSPIVVGGAGVNGNICTRGTAVATNNQTVSIQDYDIVVINGSVARLNLADYGEDFRSIWIVCNSSPATILYDHLSHPIHTFSSSGTWVRMARRVAGVYGWVNLGDGTATPVTTV